MNRRQNRPRAERQKRKRRFQPFVLLTVGVTFLVTCVLCHRAISPKQYFVNVGDIAQQTITAPRDVVDTLTTNRKKQAARDNVQQVFKQEHAITDEVMEKVGTAMDALEEVRQDGIAEKARIAVQPTPNPEESSFQPSEPPVFSAAFLQRCREKYGLSFLSDADLMTVLTAEASDVASLQEYVLQQVEETMNAGIKADGLKLSIDKIAAELNDLDVNAAQHHVAMAVVSNYLQANFRHDQAATEAAKKAAEEGVPPEIYRKDQNIVREGEEVTAEQYQMLTDLGLTAQANTGNRALAGVGILITLLFIVSGVFILVFSPDTLRNVKQTLVLCLSFLFTLLVAWQVKSVSPYIMFAPMAAMLVTVMQNRRLAIAVNLVLSVLVGFLWAKDMTLALTTAAATASLLGGTLAVCLIFRSPQRATFVAAGLAVGLLDAFVFAAVDILNSVAWSLVLQHGLIALGGGLVVGVVCLGVMPVFEVGFGLVTPIRMMELSNPNQPLLKKLLLETPGTYHHSVIVGNMAEQAAEAVGANAMLARAGAFYHDIGKTKRPIFFKENQVGQENPHDVLEPELSKKIILTHVSDGLEMARHHRLPQVIIDIIGQHHGTTLVAYFYHKAKAAAPEGTVIDQSEYRYPGPRPVSKEAAIIMMADSVEAAVRTIHEPNAEKVEEMIRNIVKGKLDDGQLSDCQLTLGEIERVIRVFCQSLNGIYHERIEYPAEPARQDVRYLRYGKEEEL